MSCELADSRFSRGRALAAFRAYVSRFDTSAERIALKVEHTYEVADLCGLIARGEGLGARDVDLAWLCGLLHDIGRFEQLRRWDTFDDSRSCSHARLGLRILEGAAGDPGSRTAGTGSAPCGGHRGAGPALHPGGELERFTRDPDWAPVVKRAVALHSDLSLPSALSARDRMFCTIVRDADKVDILRVYSESTCEAVLGISAERFAGGSFSDAAMEGFEARRCLARSERTEDLDGLLATICLVFELEHRTSIEALESRGYLRSLLDRPFGIAPEFSDPATRGRWDSIRRSMGCFLGM